MDNCRILIVDDNAANLKVARFALESEGYQVWTAADAEEALGRIQDICPRLILMDLQLPGMDGLELTRLLKSSPATKNIIVVAVTAYAMVGDREKALRMGCDGYITKPIDPILLPSQISEHLVRAGYTPSSEAGAPFRGDHEPKASDRAPQSAGVAPLPDVSKLIILVVEDDRAARKMYRLTLESAGYGVIDVPDAATALATLQYCKPDFIIQHLNLPDVNGLEMPQRFRAELGEGCCPILGVSGLAAPDAEAEAASHGFAELLRTPIDPLHLIEAVKTHIANPAASDWQGNGRVLVVVDDDPQQRKLAQSWFSSAGYKVVLAETGAEALDLIRKERPVALVSDVLMPSMDGFTLCLTVRTDPALAQIPVILTSAAYSERADHDLAKRVGATALLTKEGGLDGLSRALARTLETVPRDPPSEPAHVIEAEHFRRQTAQLQRQVLENTSLLRRTVLHQAQIAVFAGVAEGLANHVLVDAVIGDVLAACLDMAGVSRGALYVRKGENRVELKQHAGFSKAEQEHLIAGLNHPELLGRVTQTGSMIAVPSHDIAPSTAWNILTSVGLNSLLLAPVTTAGETCGVLLLGAAEGETPDWNTVAMAEALGRQMGQALCLVQAFEKLAGSEARYRTLTENANDAICISTPAGIIREVNRRFTEITGFSTEQIVGRSLQQFPTQKSDAANTRRYEFQKGAGQTAFIDFSEAEVEFDGEKLVFSIGRDVTSQMEAQARKLVADRMISLGILAAGVAHEINNPLAVVLGNLELADAEAANLTASGAPAAMDALRDDLKEAIEAGKRVRMIVTDLKVFSRVEEQDGYSLGPVDLKAALESALRLSRNETSHRARVVESYGDVPFVNGSEARLIQVFLNLIVNAAQSIEEGRADANQIRIVTRLDPSGRVAVDITDTGQGIPDELLVRLFTPFVTSKPTGVGTGLGLSICKQIVTEFDGEITVESKVGSGTTFSVLLQRSTAPPSPKGIEAKPSKSARRGKVLIVDDNLPLGKLLQRMLVDDHEVTVHQLSSEALAMLKKGAAFDVILCDMMMPEMSGPEFYRELMLAAPEQAQRVVFLTGGIFTAAAREFLDSVPNLIVSKPIDHKSLRALVNERVR